MYRKIYENSICLLGALLSDTIYKCNSYKLRKIFISEEYSIKYYFNTVEIDIETEKNIKYCNIRVKYRRYYDINESHIVNEEFLQLLNKIFIYNNKIYGYLEYIFNDKHNYITVEYITCKCGYYRYKFESCKCISNIKRNYIYYNRNLEFIFFNCLNF